MEKVALAHDSYAYTDFVTEEERIVLRDWIFSLLKTGKLKSNKLGGTTSRFWGIVQRIDCEVPPEFHDIKKRLMTLESLKEEYLDDHLYDFLSINLDGAVIQPHIDPNRDGCIHTRYNLIVSKPEVGGQPVYGKQLVDYQEGMLWRCEAGKYIHTSIKTEGKKPRMNISFGFQIPIESN